MFVKNRTWNNILQNENIFFKYSNNGKKLMNYLVIYIEYELIVPFQL
jgi:hypothetical protein